MADQIPLIGPRGGLLPRTARPAAPDSSGRVRVLVDSPLPQLDRTFDFSVPAPMKESARPGVRVRVRLAGRRHLGYVVAEGGDPGYDGPVRPLDAVVSGVPVLSPEVLRLCEAVADHYAGGTGDVVRLAVPPRVAAAEAGWTEVDPTTVAAVPVPPRDASLLGEHPWLAATAAGGSTRAVWTCPAGSDWAREAAHAAAAAAAGGRGVLIVVPDGRDVGRVISELVLLGSADCAVLRAEDGATVRYRNFLTTLSGAARIVVGTRAAAFAPVKNLGLVIICDDGDPTHADPHAPYAHAREVLVLRSHLIAAAMLIVGHARSCEAQRLVDRGWAVDITERAALRQARPLVTSTQDRVFSPLDLARRFPEVAADVLRRGLAAGPVLVHVARSGYVPVTACQSCREPADCPLCGGPVELTSGGSRCRRCGDTSAYHCPHCGGTRLRAVRVGAGRTAEELARLFPDHPVALATAESPLEQPPTSGIVVATSGMEPRTPPGYAAAYLPDAQSDLWRPDVRAHENALRRWCNALALVRPGAPVVINADPGEEAVQALIRWDPVGFAQRELAGREADGLPPARRLVQIDGAAADVDDMLAALRHAVAPLRVLGPRTLEDGDKVRVLLTSPDGSALVAEVRRAVVARSGNAPVRVQVDPTELD